MNNKGFTLIELLVTIILISILMTISTVSVIGLLNKSKQKSYDILIKNIETATENFYEECDNANLIETKINAFCVEKISTIPNTNNKVATVSLKDLVNYGFLKSSSKNNNNKTVTNPKDNKDIGDCKITITKNIDSKGIVTYTITPVSNTNESCPVSY